MKRSLYSLVGFLLISPFCLFSQTIAGFSLGAGMGTLEQDFTDSGSDAGLIYTAPGINLEAELLYNNIYMNMGLNILIAPVKVTQGNSELDLQDYSINYGLDFTAIGFGYLVPITDSLQAGGALGFHVSSIALSPAIEDNSLLTLEGYYGLIGLSFTPRIRYKLSDSLGITFSTPIGLDFSKMSEEEFDAEGNPTGSSNPAVIYPDTLLPLYRGMSFGIYCSIGYFLEI